MHAIGELCSYLAYLLLLTSHLVHDMLHLPLVVALLALWLVLYECTDHYQTVLRYTVFTFMCSWLACVGSPGDFHNLQIWSTVGLPCGPVFEARTSIPCSVGQQTPGEVELGFWAVRNQEVAASCGHDRYQLWRTNTN